MTVATCRFIAIILFLVLICIPLAYARDVSESCYNTFDNTICCGHTGQRPCTGPEIQDIITHPDTMWMSHEYARLSMGMLRSTHWDNNGCNGNCELDPTTGLCKTSPCGNDGQGICRSSGGEACCNEGNVMVYKNYRDMCVKGDWRTGAVNLCSSPREAAPATRPGAALTGNLPGQGVQNPVQGFSWLEDWFNTISPLDVNWNAVPGAMSGSLTPAMIGALGAFLGIVLGAYTILPDGGFFWSGWPEGGRGPRSDDQAVPTEQVTGPGIDMALFPARGTIDMVDPAYREKVKEWLKNQVYFAGNWYVTDDGKYVASNFMLPDNPTPENTKIPIDELLSVDLFSARVPSDLHLILAMQAAAQIPLDDLEKLRRERWSTLSDSEKEALLRRLVPIFGAPIHATDTQVDIWKPGLVRPEGAPTAPIPDNVPAQQYKINHGHGNFESHIELNSTNPGWKEKRALNAVIMVGHELKHVQQGSVVDMEGYSPDDISRRNILVRQSYNSAYHPSIDPSRYAGNYIERDAHSYGTKLAAQISKRLLNPDTKAAIKVLDDLRKIGTEAH